MGREQIDAGEDSRTARVNDRGRGGVVLVLEEAKEHGSLSSLVRGKRLVLDRDNLEEKERERERRHIEKIRLKSTIKHPKHPTTT